MAVAERLCIDPGRVAAYVRWSTDDQGRGTTLAEQRTACEHYIRAQGWHFDQERLFVDDGYSGATLDRPALSALRRAVRSGTVQCVVVYALDRLSRSVVDTVDLVLKEWDQAACVLRCVREPIDTGHPAGRVFFSILASFAEFERDLIRLRTLSGKQQRARQGANAGWRYNYGFTRGPAPGSYQVEPAQAAVVRRIFRDYLAGWGYRELAAQLNAEGIPSPAGRRWSAGGVRAILANPIYMGRLEYGKERRVRREGRIEYYRSATPAYARVEGAVPALVDAATWDAVQELRRQRAGRSPRSLGPGGYLLTGLARCGRCGRPLAGTRSRQVRYYRCLGRREHGAGVCNAGAIRAGDLERLVAEQVVRALAADCQAALVAHWPRQQAVEREQAAARLALLRRERTEAQEARQRLDGAFDRGRLDPRVYSRRCLELDERVAVLAARIAEAEGQIRELTAGPPDGTPADGTAGAPAGAPHQGAGEAIALGQELDPWAGLAQAERKALVQELVAGLAVYRESRVRRGQPLQAAEVCLTLLPDPERRRRAVEILSRGYLRARGCGTAPP